MTPRRPTAAPPVRVDGPLAMKRPRPRVLMLTHRTPYPPDRGDRIRAYHVLRELSRRCDVCLAAVSDEPINHRQHIELSKLTARLAIQRISPRYSRIRGGAALLTGAAITPTMLYRRRLADTIQRWHRNEPFDAVLTFCSGMIGYARLLLETPRRDTAPKRPTRVRHILDLVDVDSVKWARYAQDTRAPMRWVYAAEADRLQRIESGKHTAFDAVCVVSDAEARRYRRLHGVRSQLRVIGNGVDLDYFQPMPLGEQRTVVFTGVLDYRPNVDAVRFFARQVMPALRQRVTGARLLVVGKRPAAAVQALDGAHGVEVVGPVADVRPYLARATAAVAPLRFAPGVQNKVLEAMACARPVVCSSTAARGIDAKVGRELLVADEPLAYVAEIEKLMLDEKYRRHIGACARRRVEMGFAWENVLTPMVELVCGKSRVRPFAFRRAA